MADNFYYIVGETIMSGCLFWEMLKMKKELDSAMVNLEQGAMLYFQTLLLVFTLGHNYPSWLSSEFCFVKQLYRIVNGNQSIYEVQKKARKAK